MGKSKLNSRASLLRLKTICDALANNGAMTARDIEAITGYKVAHLYCYLEHLKDQKRIHICGFKYPDRPNPKSMNRTRSAIFKIGEGDGHGVCPGTFGLSLDAIRASSFDDRKIIVVNAKDQSFPRNNDPLMRAFFGMNHETNTNSI